MAGYGNPPAGRGLPWHPQEYNEHTSQAIPQALFRSYGRYALVETYFHTQLPFGLDHMQTGDVYTIQYGIRGAPRLPQDEMQRLAIMSQEDLG